MKKYAWLIDVAHYGSSALLLGMAGLTELGVSFPGITVDPKIAGGAGIGILVAGFKGGLTAGPRDTQGGSRS